MVKRESLVLFDNVQFIYELVLAQLELRALGVEFELSSGLREFEVVGGVADLSLLKRRLAYFKLVDGEYTDYFRITERNRKKSVNQYLTHWIYPYKGKFHPQMIRALLNIIGLREGDTVLDPFIGSGTTAVEAQLLGINVIGIDVSPLCVLQSKVKTESIEVLPELLAWKERILKQAEADFAGLDRLIEGISDERVKNFYLMSKLVAVSDNVRRRKNLIAAFKKNLELMLLSVKDYVEVVRELGLKLGKVDVKVSDSRDLPIADNSIDGIITSPPYSVALDYVSNDAHALEVLGYDLNELREEFIGVRGKGKSRISLYNEDMKEVLEEMHRVLKPGKYAVIIIGNATYQGKEIKTTEFIIDYAGKLGFELVENVDKIIFGLYNVMQKENILIFKNKQEVPG